MHYNCFFFQGMPVPTAIIVCEGDIETISHIAGALQQNLPVIIMKGSGKAADLILDFVERFAKAVINTFKDSFIAIIGLYDCIIKCYILKEICKNGTKA